MVIRLIKSISYRFSNFYNRWWLYFHSKEYPIIKEPTRIFEVLYHIKDATWETNYAPPVFESAKERAVTGRFPAVNIYLIPEAVVCSGSDVIYTTYGAYWDKFIDDDFSACAVPADSNVISFNHDVVRINSKRKEQYVSGLSYSLVGVWSNAWAHFIYEFLGKLYYAGELGLLNQEINLLTDDSNDSNIEQIIDDYISLFPKVKRIIVNSDVDYRCEKLAFCPCLSNNYNECKYYLEYRFIVPQNDIDIIRKHLIDPINDKIKDNPIRYKKIFLPRTHNRYMYNNSEVEDFFKSEGFHFLDTSSMSLEEKADIFYHADVVAGIGGGAFINLIFCNGARCLYLTNNRYATDMLGSALTRGRVKAYINVAGYDDNAERRSNFTIPLDKIKRAYHQLIQGDFDIL